MVPKSKEDGQKCSRKSSKQESRKGSNKASNKARHTRIAEHHAELKKQEPGEDEVPHVSNRQVGIDMPCRRVIEHQAWSDCAKIGLCRSGTARVAQSVMRSRPTSALGTPVEGLVINQLRSGRSGRWCHLLPMGETS